METKPVLMSGIKPTGDIHIGNYFGAIKQLVDLLADDAYQGYIMIADYHALNSVQDAAEMKRLTHELALTYLACGLDPEKVILFKQSDVPAHTELAWIFDTITTMPYLMRAHAFKDAEAKSKEISVGTFNYPMLMAADILLYDAKIVPVGQDQKQHIEYARDTAEKFNRIFTDTFRLPEPRIMPEVAVVPGTDGQKMSKSYGNTIPLFASRDELAKAVMGIVTDSSGDRPENVYAIHRLIKSDAELAPLYEEHKGKYQALKEALIEDLDAFIAPMRARYEELSKDPAAVDSILEKGGIAARAAANAKMEAVRKAVGVS
ncbi:MAG TPA: tryptophan--tRNA ligase [Candidatus Paceibacterota bacterium]|jgi:tryptophanyl-tRNA synthetase|nr:tryptophan--tRNA ligase [Candidatus Paceibacterota bacterium]